MNAGVGSYPWGVALDSVGNVYVSTSTGGTPSPVLDSRSYFNGIKKIDTSGVVTALAGSASQGHVDGTGSAARFYSPFGIALDQAGNVYVADWGVNEVRRVTPSGVTTTLAGGNLQGGFVNGVGTQASFNQPQSVAVDSSGNVYVTDRLNSAIRKITPSGSVSTFAGGAYGTADGTGTAAQFATPFGITIDSAGNLYVTDLNSVRKISPAGVVVTIATTSTTGITAGGGQGFQGVGVDGAGNVYVEVFVDTGSQVGYNIQKITPSGTVSTVPGGTFLGSTSYSLAIDSAGNLYATDYGNTLARQTTDPFEIRKITPAGVVSYLP